MRQFIFDRGLNYLAGVISMNALDEGMVTDAIRDGVRVDSDRYLIGDWELIDGIYEMSTNGKNGYSGVAHLDDRVIVVTAGTWRLPCRETNSEFTMRDGRFCGDLAHPGTYGEAYSLPPDFYLEVWKHEAC